MLRDTNKLMDQRSTTQDSIVIYLYFASYLGSITQNHMISELTVMSNMRISHKQAVATYDGLTTRGGSTIDCSTLANSRMITDDRYTIFSCKLEILRNPPNNCSRMNMAVHTDARATLDYRMALDDRPFSYLSILFDHSKGMYDHSLC